MGVRAITYPLAALLVPAAWTIWTRLRGPTRFPWDIDALIAAPFVIDVAGNAANLYDTVTWFDDACHFVNWALLATAASSALRRTPAIPRWLLGSGCAPSRIQLPCLLQEDLAEVLTITASGLESVAV